MKPAQITPIDSGPPYDRAGIDWLTLALICVAFLLIATLAAIGVDVWLSESSGGAVVGALGPTQPTASPTATPTLPSPSPAPTEPLTPTLTPTAATPRPCVPPDDWAIHLVE